jgi:hypothetical protein
MKTTCILGIVILVCNLSNGQTSLTNLGTVLEIKTSSDILYVTGNFINSSSATLTNNGKIYIGGNLINDQASILTGTGTLYLNGSSTQSVEGTAVFKTFNLNTNNAAGITLNNNLSVSGTHTFVAGDIASSATPNYLIYENTASHTGASDAAHVTGWVKKLGNTDFTFPTGNGNYLREIAVSNLSASMEINGKYQGATHNMANLTSPLVSINPSEYWTLTNVTGGGTTAQVTLNWNDPKVAFPNYVLADIRSAQYDLGTSSWINTGGSATGMSSTTGSITSTPLTVLGSLSIGSVSFIVPLQFLSITAEKKTTHTMVEWKTTNEVNVKQHEVQRSQNANAFTTIGKLPAHNTGNDDIYFYPDTDNLEGTVYYRIKSVDIDGKYKYSKVVSVSYASNNIISLKNNPVQRSINLLVSSTKPGSFNYQLISTSGSLVQQGTAYYGGTGSLSIMLEKGLSTGGYILVMNDGKKLFTQKIIIE